jgi:hypothetical protein
MVKVPFFVGKQHIEAGKPCDALACPVVLAIKEVLGADAFVRVTNKDISIRSKQYVGVVRLPESVGQFLGLYDTLPRRLRMSKPFGFSLSLIRRE